MATTVVKTIGTGGDYSTLQAWEDACPANLVSADQIWQGKVKNQVFSASGTLLTISGTTVDSTHYVELTTDTGASFLDNASVRTNALRYNESNGAAIKITGAWANAVIISQNYTRISKLQFAGTSTGGGARAPLDIGNAGAAANCDVDSCIFESYSAGVSGVAIGSVSIYGANTIRNSLVIQRKNSNTALIAQLSAGASAYNCTFASIGGTVDSGLFAQYGSGILKNVYVGGATAPKSGSASFTITTCHTSATASGWTTTAQSTSTFENITDGTHDFRLKTGSGLIDVGTTDSTNAANDISGTARSGAYDVGAWEYVSAVGTDATTISATTGPVVGSIASHPVPRTAITATLGNVAGSVTSTGSTTNGTFTSEVLKDYAGNILASVSLNFVRFYSDTTGALVLNKTGVSTNGSGIVTFSDAALVAGTTYRVDWETTAGSRRMPRKAAA